MEHNYDNRDFEQFLKQNADQYRMYPSEKVWKGIHNTLHNRRKWYGPGLFFIALTTATVTWVMVSSPSTQKQALNVPATPVNSPAPEKNNSIAEILNPPIQTIKHSNSLIPVTNNSRQEIVPPGNNNIPFVLPPVNTVEEEVVTSDKKALTSFAIPVEANKESATELPVNISISDQATDNNPDLLTLASQATGADKDLKKITLKDTYPWSIESVINSYKATVNKKVTFQAYFTPTISYRRLSENTSFLNATAANNTSTGVVAFYDVNKAVTHKPGLGLELGLSARYPLTKNIKVKGGLQFNISRYEIKAFNYTGEVATISLNQGSGASSLYTWTKYRNFNGYTPNWLQNYYFSVSAPVGAELKIAGNKKAGFGVAGTIQPTYILQDRAFLITTDYKNYAEIPWLIRRWNVNTSFEAFVNNSSGKIKWQVGPQVRYQLLSSFQKKYRVKENLFDFGLKVGIMLNQ